MVKMRELFTVKEIDQKMLGPELAQIYLLLILSYRLRVSTIAKADAERVKNFIDLKGI